MTDQTNQDRALGESIKHAQAMEREGKSLRALRQAITIVLLDHDTTDPDVAANRIMVLVRSAR